MERIGWITLLSSYISLSSGAINDFRIGVQLSTRSAAGTCDGTNAGVLEYSPWFGDSVGDFRVNSWASDSIWSADPDCFRVSIDGRDNGGGATLNIQDTDIRFCIQVTDHVSSNAGNPAKEGAVRCTPWASAGGGWSAWAADSNCFDFDALRVKVEVQDAPGLRVTDAKVGIQISDHCQTDTHNGPPSITGSVSGGSSTSAWEGDSDEYNPDSVRIYGGFETSIVTADACADAGESFDPNAHVCSCQPEACDDVTGPLCHSIGDVAFKLRRDVASDLCDEGDVCCCNCPDCAPLS